MGGLLALALAVRRPAEVGVPGAAGDAVGFPCRAAGAGRAPRRAGANACRCFCGARRGAGRRDPDACSWRSIRFWRCANSSASPGSIRQARRRASFVALEDWLNDGVPLALPVALECLARLVPRQRRRAALARRRPSRSGRQRVDRADAWSCCRAATGSCRRARAEALAARAAGGGACCARRSAISA